MISPITIKGEGTLASTLGFVLALGIDMMFFIKNPLIQEALLKAFIFIAFGYQ